MSVWKSKQWPLCAAECTGASGLAWCRRPSILSALSFILTGISVAGATEPDADSAAYRSPPVVADSAVDDRRATGLRMSKSPALAVGLSAALPGAGQFYNESYWKVPVVLGLGGYFVSAWIRNDRLAEDFRNQYEASKTEDDPDGNSSLLATRDFYKNQRDTFVWYFVILYVANLVDAYVDANLYDFDVGEDLSLRLAPQMNPGPEYSVGVRLKLEF